MPAAARFLEGTPRPKVNTRSARTDDVLGRHTAAPHQFDSRGEWPTAAGSVRPYAGGHSPRLDGSPVRSPCPDEPRDSGPHCTVQVQTSVQTRV